MEKLKTNTNEIPGAIAGMLIGFPLAFHFVRDNIKNRTGILIGITLISSLIGYTIGKKIKTTFTE